MLSKRSTWKGLTLSPPRCSKRTCPQIAKILKSTHLRLNTAEKDRDHRIHECRPVKTENLRQVMAFSSTQRRWSAWVINKVQPHSLHVRANFLPPAPAQWILCGRETSSQRSHKNHSNRRPYFVTNKLLFRTSVERSSRRSSNTWLLK